MERKQIVNRLGIGARVMLIWPRRGSTPVKMRLQVQRRWGWRTIATAYADSSPRRMQAEQWLKDYEQNPKRFQRR